MELEIFKRTEAVDMNGRFQMQGGKNWFSPKEMNANRFFCDSHWLEIWSNHFYPSMGPNRGSVAMDSGVVLIHYFILGRLYLPVQQGGHESQVDLQAGCKCFSFPLAANFETKFLFLNLHLQ